MLRKLSGDNAARSPCHSTAGAANYSSVAKFLARRCRYLLFVGKSRLRPADASGKFFAHFRFHMANTILVGAQWGDEGKGKIIDVLTGARTSLSAARAATMPGTQSFTAARNISCI